MRETCKGVGPPTTRTHDPPDTTSRRQRTGERRPARAQPELPNATDTRYSEAQGRTVLASFATGTAWPPNVPAKQKTVPYTTSTPSRGIHAPPARAVQFPGSTAVAGLPATGVALVVHVARTLQRHPMAGNGHYVGSTAANDPQTSLTAHTITVVQMSERVCSPRSNRRATARGTGRSHGHADAYRKRRAERPQPTGADRTAEPGDGQQTGATPSRGFGETVQTQSGRRNRAAGDEVQLPMQPHETGLNVAVVRRSVATDRRRARAATLPRNCRRLREP